MIQASHSVDNLQAAPQLDASLHDFIQLHADSIKASLKRLGAVHYDLWLPESHRLAYIIQPNEELLGVVYGRYIEKTPQGQADTSRGALIATDRRVLLLNSKPLFERCDEIAYQVISGITYSHIGPIGNVTLHTRVGDVNVRTFNQRCASGFVRAIEAAIYRDQGRRQIVELVAPS